MSLEVLTLVWNADLKFPAAKTLVLLDYADHAHDDGSEARPKIETVAKRCKLSELQARRWVHELRDQEYLIVEREATNKRPACYIVNVDLLRSLQYAPKEPALRYRPRDLKPVQNFNRPRRSEVSPARGLEVSPARGQGGIAGDTSNPSRGIAGESRTLLAPEPPTANPPESPPFQLFNRAARSGQVQRAARESDSPSLRSVNRSGKTETERAESQADREAMLDIGLMPIENVNDEPVNAAEVSNE